MFPGFSSLFDLFESHQGPRFLGVSQSNDQKSLILRVETPGIKKEDISIDMEGNTLKISVQSQDKKSKFEKKIFLGHNSEIDTKNISAKYENGLLEIFLPKCAPEVQKGRKIDIQSKL
jgi:HSP20 family protein